MPTKNDYTPPRSTAQSVNHHQTQPTAEEVAQRFPDSKRSGDGWLIPCPCHTDEKPSLSVSDTDKDIIVHCYAGCTAGEGWRKVKQALGIYRSGNGWDKSAFVVAVYSHPDGRTRPRYREDHDGDCWRDDCTKIGKHKHIWGEKGRSSTGCDLLTWGNDAPEKTLVLVEGEKAAAALLAHVDGKDYTPVTWNGGASVSKSIFDIVDGRDVILWPDADGPGKRAMQNAGKSAADAGASSIRLIDVADLPDKADAADVDAERALTLLQGATAHEVPANEPAASQPAASGGGELVTTVQLDKFRRDEILRGAANAVADAGQYMALYDSFWQRDGQGWRPTEDHSVRAVLQDAAAKSYNATMHSGIEKESVLHFAWLTRPEADRRGLIQREDRWRNVRLDTGAIISGAVFGNEIVWIEGDQLRRRPVEEHDFILSRRPYKLPEIGGGAGEVFYQFLETSFGDRADERRLLMEYCGRALLQSVSDQKFLILRGPGRAGKGAVIRLLELLMGEGQSTAYSTLAELGKRFQTARLQGRGLAVIGDLAERPRGSLQKDDYLAGAGLLKAITGEDVVTVERKNKDAFAARLDVTFVAASNHPPQFLTSGADSGAWRERMLLCVFPTQVDAAKRVEGVERAHLRRLWAGSGCRNDRRLPVVKTPGRVHVAAVSHSGNERTGRGCEKHCRQIR